MINNWKKRKDAVHGWIKNDIEFLTVEKWHEDWNVIYYNKNTMSSPKIIKELSKREIALKYAKNYMRSH